MLFFGESMYFNDKKNICVQMLYDELDKQGAPLPKRLIIEILLRSGLADYDELIDMSSEDESVWAKEYTSKITNKLHVHPLTVKKVIQNLETMLLQDLYTTPHGITIPHTCRLQFVQKKGVRKVIMREFYDSVRDKIEYSVSAARTKKHIKELSKREKKHGHS